MVLSMASDEFDVHFMLDFKGLSKAASCSKPKGKPEDAAVFVGKPIEARFGPTSTDTNHLFLEPGVGGNSE